MFEYKKKFNILLGIKSEPNTHEIHLFERGQKYIEKLSRIPGIEMIAIVNSLSMYATHPDSDIDLFIVTKPGMIWFVRFFSTFILWKHGVWRKGEDIRENLCLSFFITTEAMNLQEIAIENDIYLYYWISHMKPIFVQNNTYEKFIEANNWVEIDEKQKMENLKYIFGSGGKTKNSLRNGLFSSLCKFCISVDEIFVKIGTYLNFPILENESNTDNKMKHGRFRRLLLLLVIEVREITSKNTQKNKEDSETSSAGQKQTKFYKKINQIIRFFLFPQTLRSKEKLGNPEGIIISDSILKFHDQDRRKEIRDTILENNFDK